MKFIAEKDRVDERLEELESSILKAEVDIPNDRAEEFKLGISLETIKQIRDRTCQSNQSLAGELRLSEKMILDEVNPGNVDELERLFLEIIDPFIQGVLISIQCLGRNAKIGDLDTVSSGNTQSLWETQIVNFEPEAEMISFSDHFKNLGRPQGFVFVPLSGKERSFEGAAFEVAFKLNLVGSALNLEKQKALTDNPDMTEQSILLTKLLIKLAKNNLSKDKMARVRLEQVIETLKLFPQRNQGDLISLNKSLRSSGDADRLIYQFLNRNKKVIPDLQRILKAKIRTELKNFSDHDLDEFVKHTHLIPTINTKSATILLPIELEKVDRETTGFNQNYHQKLLNEKLESFPRFKKLHRWVCQLWLILSSGVFNQKTCCSSSNKYEIMFKPFAKTFLKVIRKEGLRAILACDQQKLRKRRPIDEILYSGVKEAVEKVLKKRVIARKAILRQPMLDKVEKQIQTNLSNNLSKEDWIKILEKIKTADSLQEYILEPRYYLGLDCLFDPKLKLDNLLKAVISFHRRVSFEANPQGLIWFRDDIEKKLQERRWAYSRVQNIIDDEIELSESSDSSEAESSELHSSYESCNLLEDESQEPVRSSLQESIDFSC